MVRRGVVASLCFAATLAALCFSNASAQTLKQTGSIPLGNVAGDINGLVLDFANQRLFVLEGGAGQLAVVDLPANKVTQTIERLNAPVGLARAPTENRLYIANGDGKVLIYVGAPLKAETEVMLGKDLGAVHYDPGSERMYLPFGPSKVAIFDSIHNKHWNDTRLDGRAGPLALADGSTLMYIGAAGDKRIMVVDRDNNKQTGSWATGDWADPVSLALDEDAGRLVAAFGKPAGLVWFDLADGSMKGHADSCARPGQLLADGSRGAVYLTCADGSIQVFHRDAAGNYAKSGSIDTAPGATAAVMVPLSGRVFLAVPANGSQAAEIRIYEPAS